LWREVSDQVKQIQKIIWGRDAFCKEKKPPEKEEEEEKEKA